MKKHAVPQNIMDVEFKLFGSLTVRQFSYVAVSFLLAFVIYISGLPQLVTIPLVAISVIIGLSLAFLKVNDQPFTVWFTNFVTNLFSSQRRVYRKKSIGKAGILDTPADTNPRKTAVKKKVDPRKAEILRNIEQKVDANDNFEEEELEILDDGLDDPLTGGDNLSRIDKYFESAVSTNLSKYGIENNKSEAKPVKSEEKIVQQENVKASTIESEQPSKPAQRETKQQLPVDIEKQPSPKETAENSENSSKQTQSDSVRNIKISGATMPTEQKVESIQVHKPQAEFQQEINKPKVEEKINSNNQNTDQQVQKVGQSEIINDGQNDQQELNNNSRTKITLQNKLKPNQIAGFVTGNSGEVISRAKVNLIDIETKLPVRSVFTDQTGKFIVPSQLDNGRYKVEIQVEGREFPEYFLELKGELVPLYKYSAKT